MRGMGIFAPNEKQTSDISHFRAARRLPSKAGVIGQEVPMLSATFSHFGAPGMLTFVQVHDRSPGFDEARVRDGSSALIPLRLDLLAAGDILETPRPGF